MRTNKKLSQIVSLALLASMTLGTPVWAGPQHDNGDDQHRPMNDEPGQPARHANGPQEYQGGDRQRQGFERPGHAPRYAEGWGGVRPEHARQFARDAGFHGYQPLPPGMRRRLVRGHALPPGMAVRPLPPEMMRRMPAPRPGYEWRVAGSDLVLVAVGSAIVADIVVNAFR
jgi:Ni/Co efflux regulator RcnB